MFVLCTRKEELFFRKYDWHAFTRQFAKSYIWMNIKIHIALEIQRICSVRMPSSCFHVIGWHNYIIHLICLSDMSKYSVRSLQFLFTERSVHAQNPLPKLGDDSFLVIGWHTQICSQREVRIHKFVRCACHQVVFMLLGDIIISSTLFVCRTCQNIRCVCYDSYSQREVRVHKTHCPSWERILLLWGNAN